MAKDGASCGTSHAPGTESQDLGRAMIAAAPKTSGSPGILHEVSGCACGLLRSPAWFRGLSAHFFHVCLMPPSASQRLCTWASNGFYDKETVFHEICFISSSTAAFVPTFSLGNQESLLDGCGRNSRVALQCYDGQRC